jgi:ATP-dependent DNA helicase RecG
MKPEDIHAIRQKWEGDRISKDGESLTVAALLLFGKAGEIKRMFPAFRLDIIRIKGTEWGKDRDPFLSRDLKDNLLSLRAPAMDFLERFFLVPFHADTRGDRISENAHRKSLREALTNLLMHQNYFHPSPSQVRIYNDRVEFYNPGYSLKDPSLYNMPGSELRNPSIASVFYDIGWAEAKGTGLRTTVKQLSLEGYPGPEYLNDVKNDTFTFVLRHHSAEALKTGTDQVADQDTDQVTDQVAATVDRRALTLDYCRTPRSLREIMSHLGLRHKPNFVEHVLKPLMEKGLIVMTVPEKPKSRFQKYVKVEAL